MHLLNTKEMNNLKFFLLGFMLWTATSNAQSLDTRKSFILVGASVEIPKNTPFLFMVVTVWKTISS